MVQKVIVFLLITGVANAVIYQEKLSKIPDHLSYRYKTGCYLKEQDTVLPFYAEVSADNCVRVKCTPHSIMYTKCDAPQISDPSCKIVQHPWASYPECCPQEECG